MSMRVPLLLTALMLSLSLAGCLEGGDVPSSIGDTTGDEIDLPVWEIGDQWLYSFVTPQFGEDSARLVVAEIDDGEQQYLLGISNEREAQRHAVINHNPFLGRINIDGLSVFEEGEPQQVFNFPWENGQQWSFNLFGISWDAETNNIYNGVANVVATSDDGQRLQYEFSGRKGFIESLVWTNDTGVEQLRMTLTLDKKGYDGDVFFYRARDLMDQRYENSQNDIYDSFLDSGHPSGEDWNVLVWYLDVEISNGGGSGSLSMKDHAGASPLTRAWGAGATEKGAIGTIPSNSGEYSLTVTVRGPGSFIHLKVAGALVTQWTL